MLLWWCDNNVDVHVDVILMMVLMMVWCYRWWCDDDVDDVMLMVRCSWCDVDDDDDDASNFLKLNETHVLRLFWKRLMEIDVIQKYVY